MPTKKVKQPTNVIRLISNNEKPNKPEAAPAQLPIPWESKDVSWHVHMATWMLRWRSNDNDVFQMLTPQEARFLARMTIWDEKPTENQTRWIKKIAEKITTILAMTDPNPAA